MAVLPISAALLPIPAAIGDSAGAEPIVAWLTKHHKTLWNIQTLYIRYDNISTQCGDTSTLCCNISSQHGVSCHCGVGITLQMCNTVTELLILEICFFPGLALFDFFLLSICWNLCNLAVVKCLLILSWPNLYKSKIFYWSNYGTKGVDRSATYGPSAVQMQKKHIDSWNSVGETNLGWRCGVPGAWSDWGGDNGTFPLGVLLSEPLREVWEMRGMEEVPICELLLFGDWGEGESGHRHI